jgi:hypothetical protein
MHIGDYVHSSLLIVTLTAISVHPIFYRTSSFCFSGSETLDLTMEGFWHISQRRLPGHCRECAPLSSLAHSHIYYISVELDIGKGA